MNSEMAASAEVWGILLRLKHKRNADEALSE